jgi:hypothetical protein
VAGPTGVRVIQRKGSNGRLRTLSRNRILCNENDSPIGVQIVATLQEYDRAEPAPKKMDHQKVSSPKPSSGKTAMKGPRHSGVQIVAIPTFNVEIENEVSVRVQNVR